MKLVDLTEVRYGAQTRREPSPAVMRRYQRTVDSMPFETRHEWVRFIYDWLSGSFMKGQSANVADRWREFARLFPPGVSAPKKLYRVVTIPIEKADTPHIRFRPAPGAVSSWTEAKIGLDFVAGIARDIEGGKRAQKTARVGIQAVIPADAVLATRVTIRYAFLALTHDYWDRFPEETVQKQIDGVTRVSTYNKDWPEQDDEFTMGDVGYYQDLLSSINGGPYRQYEWVVETPPTIDAVIVKRYRIGNKVISSGHDDPHNS